MRPSTENKPVPLQTCSTGTFGAENQTRAMAGAALSEELMETQEAQADYLAPLIAWLTKSDLREKMGIRAAGDNILG